MRSDNEVVSRHEISQYRFLNVAPARPRTLVASCRGMPCRSECHEQARMAETRTREGDHRGRVGGGCVWRLARCAWRWHCLVKFVKRPTSLTLLPRLFAAQSCAGARQTSAPSSALIARDARCAHRRQFSEPVGAGLVRRQRWRAFGADGIASASDTTAAGALRDAGARGMWKHLRPEATSE